MPSLKVIWAVPLIIGSRETGGRSDFPTTAYWYQVLLRKRPDLKIFVTTAPTQREQESGTFGSATRLLQVKLEINSMKFSYVLCRSVFNLVFTLFFIF